MKRTAVLALVLCLLLSGCAPLTARLNPIDAQVSLPLPEADTPAPAVGDTIAPGEVDVTLYFPSADAQALVPMRTTLALAEGEPLPRRLVQALLSDSAANGARRAAPEGTAALSVRQFGDIAVADLSIDARGVENDRQLFLMRAAIARTLCGVNGIRTVDVLIAGRAESPFVLPCGAGDADSLSAGYAQALAEDRRVGGESFTVRRTAVLYYPARDGLSLVPQARGVSVGADDLITPLLAALADGTGLDPALRPALPDTDSPFVTGAEIVTLENGRRVARLVFDGNLSAILERARLNAWQLFASITCTLTGFIPALDGIQVYVGAGQLARLESPEGGIALENGVLTRAQFERMTASLETIYMTARDGSLRALGRAMAPEDAASPRMVLALLFGEPEAWEEDVSRVIPDGLSADDILGIRVADGEAVLNLSGAFYARCQRLTPQQERNLIYALVNTLTERPDVNAVRFQFEGETIPSLAHDISLLGPLMRNPGLISRAEPDDEA